MSFLTDDKMMLREIIVDHHKYPRNYKEVDEPGYITIHMDSASCIDDIYIQVKIVDDVIKEAFWHGKGCAISMSSTSIMTEMIKDKSVEEAEKIMDQFNKMLSGEDFDEEELGEAIAFVNVPAQPSRVTCANISWRGLKKAFDEYEKEEGGSCHGH